MKAEHWNVDGLCAENVVGEFMGRKVPCTLFIKAGWKVVLEEAGFEFVHTEEDLFTPGAADWGPELRYYIIARKV